MAKKRTARTARPPLDRDRVLRAAIELADDGGIEALSMRRLGRTLGVEAMSLYNHVSSKDDVLAGIVDIIVGDIDVETPAVSWKEAMRRRAISMREAFARHPWAVGLLESRKSPGPAALRYCESVLRVLRRAGFSPEMALRAFSVLDSYAYGYSIQEKSMASDSAMETSERSEEFLRQLPGDGFPYLAEIASHVARSGFEYAREFELGLDLLLDALDSRRDAE
jgi:AcrR family transcriptional regulator